MAKRDFIVDIDLNNNQLRNVVLQNLGAAPGSPAPGQMYYNSGSNTAFQWNGTVWKDMLADGGSYTHPTYTALAPTLTGANVLATFSVDAQGHVDAATTRVLSLADLGYTGATDANNYVHPSDGVDLGAALTGATVISDVNVNAAGHVTGFATRGLTAADIGAAVINDAATNTTQTLSSQEIADRIAAALTSASTYIGGYDAATNTPDLDTAPSGISKGDTYTVTAAGTFFTEDMQVGDVLIAEIDNPTTLGDWTTLNKNIPDIVPASETEQGIIELADQAEVNAGTDAVRAVTPATLQTKLNALPVSTLQQVTDAGSTTSNDITISKADATGYLVIQDTTSLDYVNINANNFFTAKGTGESFTASGSGFGLFHGSGGTDIKADLLTGSWVLQLPNKSGTIATLADITGGAAKYAETFGNGALTTFTITHSLNTLDVTIRVVEVATGITIECQEASPTVNTVQLDFNTAPTSNQYRVIVTA